MLVNDIIYSSYVPVRRI